MVCFILNASLTIGDASEYISHQSFDSVFKEAGIHAKIIKEYIEKIGKSDETIIVFFADHGTGIGERFGERNYGSYTYEETIRTFFLFLGKKI